MFDELPTGGVVGEQPTDSDVHVPGKPVCKVPEEAAAGLPMTTSPLATRPSTSGVLSV